MVGAPSHDESRISRLDDRLRAGDADAETLVVRRFTVQLVTLARRHLAQRIRQKTGPEDAVQSAFRSFFKRVRRGQFDLDSWDGLWSLLALITVRKCSARREHFQAARRDVRREVRLSNDDDPHTQHVALSRAPRPDEALALAELIEQLLNDLSDSEQQVVHLRLQGYGINEICQMLSRADRTVRRILDRVRRRASRLTDTDETDSVDPSCSRVE